MAPILSGDAREKKLHLSSIELLAKKLSKTPEEITPIYTRVLDDLQKQARVKVFLHIFVSRRVKELMRQ